MKIKVFMSDNRDLMLNAEEMGYNSLAALINYNYCKKNSYDFTYYQSFYQKIDYPTNDRDQNGQVMDLPDIYLLNAASKNPNNGKMRHAAWSKILTSLIVLEEDYDYVVYIDSDAILRNLDNKLEDFIEKHIGDNNFIFFSNSQKIGVLEDNNSCSGFFVIKNCKEAKENLIDWWHLEGYDQFDLSPPWEQFNLHRSSIKDNMKVTIVYEHHFEEKEGQLVRHVHSGQMGKRMEYFMNVIKEQNLDFLDIYKINWKRYDTSLITSVDRV